MHDGKLHEKMVTMQAFSLGRIPLGNLLKLKLY